jgi:glycosyltransferase involved in cell wall biosynthesis
MKILHILLSIDPDYGGPAQSVPSLAAAQAALGHHVSLAFYEPHPERNSIQQARRSIPGLNLVSLIPLGSRRTFESVLAHHAKSILIEHIRTSDFIHIHNMWQPVLAMAAHLARAHKIPYAISPRGALNPWSMAQKRLKKQTALHLMWKPLLRDASFLHALNTQEALQIGGLGLESPIVVAANGVFPGQFDALPIAGSFRLTLPRLASRRFILFLSRLHKKKGLDILIDAYRQIAIKYSGVDLVIAGPDEGEGALLAVMIDHYHLTERVHLVGPLYGAAKLAALCDATVFCLPSRDEGFSMAIIEAMAAGLPVVISEQCNFPEIRDADAGLISPLNPTHLSQALSSLLDDEPLRARIASNGQILIRTSYSWEAIARRLVGAYSIDHSLQD